MPAAGVVVEKVGGRFWFVAPSNAFGGYLATFPQGCIEGGVSRQASVIREAYEEAGLKVKITGFLADSNRTQAIRAITWFNGLVEAHHCFIDLRELNYGLTMVLHLTKPPPC